MRVVGDGWGVRVGSGKPKHQKVTENTGELSNDSATKLPFKPETNANCCTIEPPLKGEQFVAYYFARS